MRWRSIHVAVLLTLLIATAANAEIVQRGNVRVSFEGQLSPHTLPRAATAPVRVSVATKIASTDGATPPQLRRISIAINRHGRLDPSGLPVCPLRRVQPSTTADALAACRSSLVGEGQFAANVMFSAQAPFPSAGKVYAFNSVIGCAASERSRLLSNPRQHPGRGWPSSPRTEGTEMRRIPGASKPIAVEVELTAKSTRRLDEILRAWRRSIGREQFSKVRYHCGPRALPYVRRAVSRTPTDGLIEVEPLEGPGRPPGPRHRSFAGAAW